MYAPLIKISENVNQGVIKQTITMDVQAFFLSLAAVAFAMMPGATASPAPVAVSFFPIYSDREEALTLYMLRRFAPNSIALEMPVSLAP